MTNTVKILIADDHQMFIDGIKSLLKKEQSISIVGEVHNGNEALEFISNNPIDLLITDISMPEIDGLELTKHVKYSFPNIKVLVISMHNDNQIISEILLAEAEGYILKNTGKTELITAIKTIAEGSTYYSNSVLTIMMQKIKKQQYQDKETQSLTERELEILNLIVQEYSTTEIADKLFISPRTVDTHRKHIMQKTNSKTIIGLIKFVFRNGLSQ